MLKKESTRVVLVVVFLLLIFSITISLFNFKVSLQSKEFELIERSLPLSVDNIYTDIQKHVMDQNLIASMMANDSFLKHWLVNDKKSDEEIKRYLGSIKNKYNLFTAFLVVENSLDYYTQNGFLEKITTDNPDNAWYYRFRDSPLDSEINLVFNQHLDNTLIMFINHKIFNDDSQLLGVTGVALKVSYLNGMLKKIRQEYQSEVFFLNESSKIVFSENKSLMGESFFEIENIKPFKNNSFVNAPKVFEYEKNGNDYIFMTKYITELDTYIIVRVKLSDFTQNIEKTLYINLIVSLLISLIISILIIIMFKRYNYKLTFLAQKDGLTGLDNKMTFNRLLKQSLAICKRQEKSLNVIFIDLDDFKGINDSLGHYAGDEVLKRLAVILTKRTRNSDIISRWGGEEFVIALNNVTKEKTCEIAEEIRQDIKNDGKLKAITSKSVTVSIGVASFQEDDNLDSLLIRADKAMYQAKKKGKDQSSFL